MILFYSHCNTNTPTIKPGITISIPVFKNFIKRMTDDKIPVLVLLEQSASPVNFVPNIKTLKLFSYSRLYFQSGLPFEKAIAVKLENIGNNTQVVALPDLLIPKKNQTGNGRSAHQHVDPHIWLSPLLMKKILIIMSKKISASFPNETQNINKNLSKIISKINDTDRKARSILNNSPQKTFLVYHPSYGWFARYYQLKMLSIEKDGTHAKIAHLQKIIQESKQAGIQTIISQPEFSSRQLDPIAKQIGARIVLSSPLQKDWHTMMICLARYISNQDCN